MRVSCNAKLKSNKSCLLIALLLSSANAFSVRFQNSAAFRTQWKTKVGNDEHRKEIPLNYLACSTRSRATREESSWGVGDDWNELSINNPENSSFDSSSIFNVDAATRAARDLELWNNDGAVGTNGENEDHDGVIENGGAKLSSEEDEDFLHHAIDTIQSESIDPAGPALYDTLDSFDEYTQTLSFQDEMGKEIALLVRCNESPEKLLVDEGRALPELDDAEKYNVSQLMIKKEQDSSQSSPSFSSASPKATSYVFEPTNFFVNSMRKMFLSHAKAVTLNNNTTMVLDYTGVASWMSTSLGEKVGPHDKRISVVMSKYATYGSGVLTEEQFVNLYVDAVMLGLDGSNRKKEKKDLQMMKKMKMKQSNLMDVWRDLENHGISPPIIAIREELQAKIDAEYGSNKFGNKMEALDECEILEWKNGAHSTPRGNNSKMNGAKFDTKKSSHESVELSSDGKTPMRIRDGEFVFIDEESCIGCYQCANIAPSSFKMVDSGRARTFHQSNSPEVAIAVSSCPVSCMHNVGFRELEKLETARDVGDGHVHHRHLSNKAHTPLHIARRGSDINHKSSWYHYLKQKCFTSKTCPQKGCYDCPLYQKPGDNPYFKKLHAAAERIRAKDIIDSGQADMWRKTADL